MTTKWKNKEVFVEVFPVVSRVESDGAYMVDGPVPNCLYKAVNTAIHEINDLMYNDFKFVYRNNRGPSWEFLEFNKERQLDHARVYFFVANQSQKQKPVGGEGAGNAQSWQKTTEDGYRSYNYPVFGLDINPDPITTEDRYMFEDAKAPDEIQDRIQWAMLHEFTHGLGLGHDVVRSPSVMNGHHGIAQGWNGHYFPNDKKFLKKLYGGIETPEPGEVVFTRPGSQVSLWQRWKDRLKK
jgi:hypothetical protein